MTVISEREVSYWDYLNNPSYYMNNTEALEELAFNHSPLELLPTGAATYCSEGWSILSGRAKLEQCEHFVGINARIALAVIPTLMKYAIIVGVFTVKSTCAFYVFIPTVIVAALLMKKITNITHSLDSETAKVSKIATEILFVTRFISIVQKTTTLVAGTLVSLILYSKMKTMFSNWYPEKSVSKIDLEENQKTEENRDKNPEYLKPYIDTPCNWIAKQVHHYWCGDWGRLAYLL